MGVYDVRDADFGNYVRAVPLDVCPAGGDSAVSDVLGAMEVVVRALALVPVSAFVLGTFAGVGISLGVACFGYGVVLGRRGTF